MNFKEWKSLSPRGEPSNSEVAKKLRVSIGAVKKYLSGARPLRSSEFPKLLDLPQSEEARKCLLAAIEAESENGPLKKLEAPANKPAAKPDNLQEPSVVDGSSVDINEPWPAWNQDPTLHLVKPKDFWGFNVRRAWTEEKVEIRWDPDRFYSISHCRLAGYEKSAAVFLDYEGCPFKRSVWELFWFYRELPLGQIAVNLVDLEEQGFDSHQEPERPTTLSETLADFVVAEQSVYDGTIELLAYKQANAGKLNQDLDLLPHETGFLGGEVLFPPPGSRKLSPKA